LRASKLSREPEGFRGTLELARVYMIMRWLGDPSQTKVSRRPAKYLRELRVAGRRLGLILGRVRNFDLAIARSTNNRQTSAKSCYFFFK
jgi:hypothetical protein